MAIVQQIQKHMLISLAQIAKNANLHEGDHIVIEEMDGGIFFLRPVDWVNKSQKYFWTEEWQGKMLKSQEDLEKGNYQKFVSMEDAIRNLESNY